MKYACQYAIIRFLPFVETGEFANVGVALFCPETGYFDFRVSNKKTKKINSFFAPVPQHIYPEGIKDITEELLRIKKLINETYIDDSNFAKGVFHELVRIRETTFRFSEIRGVLADNPKTKTEALFIHYVERGFATNEYKEKINKRISRVLSNIGAQNAYKQKDFSANDVQVRVPFVHTDENGKPTRAIKPAAIFSVQDTTQAVGKGWSLLGRMDAVRSALPHDVLIASESPEEGNDYGWEFFNQLERKFKDIDIQFIKASDEDRIKDFARIQ